MGKYLISGGYTAQSWKALIEDPSDRAAVARKAFESVGGKLETYFWTFGEDDFIAIAEFPDDASAGAAAVATASSGALRNVRTVKLITPEEGRKLLEKARSAAAAYAPPAAQPAGAHR